MIKDKILKNLKIALGKIGIKNQDIDLDIPVNMDFGDYSTSIALKLTKILKKNPLQIAGEIVKNLPSNELIEKVEILKPGFINFWITKKNLTNQLIEFSQDNITFPSFHLGPNKKIMVEFAHPNTHKLFHIGHLRNISTGESIVRIFEAVGNKVIRANYQGDVGLHIAKCLYALKNPNNKIQITNQVQNSKPLKEKIALIGKAYTEGTKAYEDNPKAKEEIIRLNKMIYDKDPKIIPLWQETVKWSLEYFDQVYKRVDSHFDRLYFESECTKNGMEICNLALNKKILEKSEGAVIFNGKKYGLDIRVFINSLGFPTYEGKELGLAAKEFSDFGVLDKNIHCVTPEQTSFFKVTFKVEELMDEKKYKNKQYHLAYNWVNLKTGKMSSRVGNVVEGPWLIDQIKNKIKEQFKCTEEIAEILAVASIKYSFLKYSPQNAIAFDINESIAVDGNSAPYIIYTYVRCQSVLKKSPAYQSLKPKAMAGRQIQISNVKSEELNLLRKFYQFPEVILKAAENYSPNFIATYLYELASQFNLFYQKCPILTAEKQTKKLRLLLTQATANIIKKGLYLLGIKTVEKM